MGYSLRDPWRRMRDPWRRPSCYIDNRMSAAAPMPSTCACPPGMRGYTRSFAAIFATCFTPRCATRSAAALAGLALLSGCTVVRPVARATDVQVVESVGGTSRVDITLALTNPGDDEVELIEYDYTLSLADGSGYGGKWAALRALPPRSTIEARIPAVVPTASLVDGGAWRVTGKVEFRDPQSFALILYEAGILHTRSEFSGDGDVIRPAQ